MVDHPDLQLARRKIRDRSVALLLVGIAFLMPPMVHVGLIGETFFGLPFALLYLFGVWGLLIVGAALLAKPLRDSDKLIARKGETDTPG